MKVAGSVDVENWQVALLTVGALLVGLIIPALWQLREALRRFAELGRKLEPVVEDAGATVKRLNRLTAGFEGREDTVVELADSMGELAAAMNRLRDTTRTATAVGAAVAAAVRAFRDVRAGEEPVVDEMEATPEETGTREPIGAAGGEVGRSNGHDRSTESNEQEATS
jgi:hypothetical protein